MFELTPFFYLLMALYFLLVMAMGWMVLDSSRPIRAQRVEQIERHTGTRREPLTFYQYFGGLVIVLYLIQRVLAFIPNIGAFYRGMRHLSFFFTLLGLVVLVAYLLRVIYPKPIEEAEELAMPPTAVDERDPALSESSIEEQSV